MTFLLKLLTFALGGSLLYAAYIIYNQFTYWKRRRMLHLKATPIFGSTAPLFFRTDAFPTFMQKLYNNFPNARYFGLFDNKNPTIMIKDPDLVRDVCIKNSENFIDHSGFISEQMDPIVYRNLFNLEGTYWKRMRNLLTPSFTASRMKLIFDLITECSDDFIQYFLDNPEVAKSFEAKDAFSRYTNDVIGTAAFGIKVNSMRDRDNDFYRHGLAASTFNFMSIVKLELMNIFPNLMRWAGFTFLPRTTDRFLKNLIAETVRVRREKGIVRQDMVHLLMLAMDKEDNAQRVTIDDIVGQAFFFIIAGFDASSSALCFACHELAVNPDIQEKLRDVINHQVEMDKGKINYETVMQMKYLDMVVSEILRMYPSATFTNRVCVTECDFSPPLNGYPMLRVEKGTQILIPIYAYHRDPKNFADPDKFDPERFSEDNKSNVNPYIYQPFGIGPRQCIGNRFALMLIKVVMIDILRKFTIKLTEKSQHPITDYDPTTFPLNRKNGFWLQFDELKKSN